MLFRALRAAEVGSNEHGPFWRTSEMVAALREFYAVMSELEPGLKG